jgi:hypothetical protein
MIWGRVMRHKVATSSAHPSNPFDQRPAFQRSRLTRKASAILEGDGRLALPRRFRDLCANIAADAGGVDRLSTIQLDLIRKYASLAMLGEKLQADLINGREVNLGELVVISSTLSRLATRIGLKRVAKDVTPSLDEFMRQRGHGRVRLPRQIQHEADKFEDAADD